ncbi:MAG: hypothetical protein SFU53_00450 [Terrimicrobiaceae bacterium]|nr:hypothetical protein [Terrimicrobiaceae bacterium]
MKTAFADRWEIPTENPAAEDFRYEENESEEVNEDKDGWAWVEGDDISDCVLTSTGTSNRLLHKLARRVRGFEKARGFPLSPEQYRAIFGRWKRASEPYLGNADYLTEFLSKLDSVKVPEGESLAAAFDRAAAGAIPAALADYPPELQILGAFCRELAAGANGGPILLAQAPIAKLLGCTPHSVSNRIKALKTLGILRVATPAIARKKAATYWFQE